MDASTTAAAALAIAVAASEQSAMEALLQERERLAMIVEDQASFLAQRHYIGSLQLLRATTWTWQTAYEQRHGDLGHAHAAMRVALQAHRRGDNELVGQVLQAEVGSSEEEAEESEADATNNESIAVGEEEEEEEVAENDAEVSPLAHSE